jgi:CDP-6-deoxy-D-xylo-4-hexulose-3-dehydrase
MNRKQLLELRRIVERNICPPEDFAPGKTKIPLSVPTYGVEEVLESIDSLLRCNVTMGKKVQEFEESFSKYIGTKNAIMVNSGSSANLVALSTLTSPHIRRRIKPGDEIITPALTWATTVFPIANIGAIPVLVDVDLADFTLRTASVREAICRRTKAILPVHLMGNPCNMRELMAISQEEGLFLVEDACEAHGAEFEGKRVGSFGDLATFSFFFSHHISTIEGGMVVTNNDIYSDIARSLRAHGWIRERSDYDRLAADYPSLDGRFLFVTQGYNVRPTEIQGAFGLHQIGRLNDFIRIRRENAQYWSRELERHSDFLIFPAKSTPSVFFGYPVTVKSKAPFTREELVNFLERKGIETRPIMAGDMTQQPAMSNIRYKVAGSLKNSRIIHSSSFFWGNHHRIGMSQRKFIADCVHEFIDQISGSRIFATALLIFRVTNVSPLLGDS